jgi:hypothetical protein
MEIEPRARPFLRERDRGQVEHPPSARLVASMGRRSSPRAHHEARARRLWNVVVQPRASSQEAECGDSARGDHAEAVAALQGLAQVSIFEPHTDIIRKDRRATYYGHKVTLSTGRSGSLQPPRAQPGTSALSRPCSRRDGTPDRVAFDGGFASKNNLHEIKNAGTKQVCFSKPAGVPIEEMTTTAGIRRTLKRFRAGMEAGLSFLKRSFGRDRVTRGLGCRTSAPTSGAPPSRTTSSSSPGR